MPRVVVNKPQPLDPVSSKELERLQQAFGEHLRSMRLERVITIEQLAELAGLHPNYVGSVERGERNLSLFNIWRLAGGLDVTVGQLTDPLPKRVLKLPKRNTSSQLGAPYVVNTPPPAAATSRSGRPR